MGIFATSFANFLTFVTYLSNLSHQRNVHSLTSNAWTYLSSELKDPMSTSDLDWPRSLRLPHNDAQC